MAYLLHLYKSLSTSPRYSNFWVALTPIFVNGRLNYESPKKKTFCVSGNPAIKFACFYMLETFVLNGL